MTFNLKKFIKSVKVALRGLKLAISEQNFRICCFIGILVIVLMFWFEVVFFEKVILIFVVALVLSAELINSQIERILDILQPNFDKKIRTIKDISAGVVLLICLAAAIIGILIFLPYFLQRVEILF